MVRTFELLEEFAEACQGHVDAESGSSSSSGSGDGGASSAILDYDLSLHVAGIFVMLASSLLGTVIPLIGVRLAFLKVHPNVIWFGRAVGTGVILATAFVHMLIPSVEALSSPCLPEEFRDSYPSTSGLIALGAIFVSQILELSLTSKFVAEHSLSGAHALMHSHGPNLTVENHNDHQQLSDHNQHEEQSSAHTRLDIKENTKVASEEGSQNDMAIHKENQESAAGAPVSQNRDGTVHAEPHDTTPLIIAHEKEDGWDGRDRSQDHQGDIIPVDPIQLAFHHPEDDTDAQSHPELPPHDDPKQHSHARNQPQERQSNQKLDQATSDSPLLGSEMKGSKWGPNYLGIHFGVAPSAVLGAAHSRRHHHHDHKQQQQGQGQNHHHHHSHGHVYRHHSHGHNHRPHTSLSSCENEKENNAENGKPGMALASSNSKPPLLSNLEQQHRHRSRVLAVILEIGITTHSIVIGISLGVLAGPEFVTLLVAIVFHQFFEGFALASNVVDAHFSNLSVVIGMLVSYALCTPLGMAIGIGIHSTYDPHSPTALIVQGTFDAISAGILIYNGLIELMTYQFTNNPSFRSLSLPMRVFVLAGMYLGATFMSVIGKFA